MRIKASQITLARNKSFISIKPFQFTLITKSLINFDKPNGCWRKSFESVSPDFFFLFKYQTGKLKDGLIKFREEIKNTELGRKFTAAV